MPMKAATFDDDDAAPEETPQETPESSTTKATPIVAEVKPPKPEPIASKKSSVQHESLARKPPAADTQAPSSIQKRGSVKKPTPVQQ